MTIENGGTEPIHGRKSAITLAYDGADPSHLELVIPALSTRGFKGSFFLPSMELLHQPQAWVAAHYDGHEMASHSLYGFTDERGNLPNWTQEMVEEDMRMSRKLLTDLFPSQADFAFAYPGDQCGCVFAKYDPKPATYDEVVEKLFRIARSGVEGRNPLGGFHPARLKCYQVQGLSYDALVRLAEKSIELGSWAIFAFEEIGSGQPGMDRRDHDAFLTWLEGQSGRLDVEPLSAYAMRALTWAP